jgi:hypothetical protein
MNRLLVVLVVLALLVAGGLGLGFYLGWFHLSKDGTSHDPNFTITVDRDKIQQDQEKAKETMQGVGQKVKGKAGAPAGKADGEAPGP